MLQRVQRQARARREHFASTNHSFVEPHRNFEALLNSSSLRLGADSEEAAGPARPPLHQVRLEWEVRHQADLRRLRDQLDHLESLRLLSYSKARARRARV